MKGTGEKQPESENSEFEKSHVETFKFLQNYLNRIKLTQYLGI